MPGHWGLGTTQVRRSLPLILVDHQECSGTWQTRWPMQEVSTTSVRTRRIPEGIWIEPSPRRVRAYLGGVRIADSKRALLVFERGPLPAYWFDLT